MALRRGWAALAVAAGMAAAGGAETGEAPGMASAGMAAAGGGAETATGMVPAFASAGMAGGATGIVPALASAGAETAGAGRAVQAASAEESGGRLERKLGDILQHSLEPSPEVRLTPLPEPEVNAYLSHQGARYLPVGIREPLVRIGDGRLSAEAVVDLDAIRDSRERTTFDPVRFLGGQLVVTASGRVRSGDGLAQVEVEAVTVGGVQVPAQVLQEVVRHFTRTAEHPAGTSLDEPIRLPYGIAELRLSPGLAVVVQ